MFRAYVNIQAEVRQSNSIVLFVHITSSIRAAIYQKHTAEACPLSVPVSGGITHLGSLYGMVGEGGESSVVRPNWRSITTSTYTPTPTHPLPPTPHIMQITCITIEREKGKERWGYNIWNLTGEKEKKNARKGWAQTVLMMFIQQIFYTIRWVLGRRGRELRGNEGKGLKQWLQRA